MIRLSRFTGWGIAEIGRLSLPMLRFWIKHAAEEQKAIERASQPPKGKPRKH